MLDFISQNLLAFIALLGIIIFVHELGHFLAAKMFKMRVERFSIGFPPRLFGIKVGETDYCISAIPFGGYVKIGGMIDESLDTEEMATEPEEWEFRAKPAWQQIIVMAAGVFFNFILAISILAISYETPIFPKTAIVGDILTEKPAAQAGIMPNDEIFQIDDTKINSWEDLVLVIQENPGKELKLKLSRNGKVETLTLIPEALSGQNGETVGKIGIVRKIDHFEPVPLGKSFVRATQQTYGICAITLASFGQMFTGEINWRENIGGPIAIMKFAGETARSSGYQDFFTLVALLSITIGLINILPFPALDGGHIFMILIEKIFRREISLKVKIIVQQTGMLALLCLMAIVLWNDVMKHVFN